MLTYALQHNDITNTQPSFYTRTQILHESPATMPSSAPLTKADYGYAQSIDDLIILLACRYGADPDAFDCDEEELSPAEEAAQQRAWALVAEGVRNHLRHPLTAEERSYVRHIDVDLFTADMCVARAQCALWRAEQRREADAKRAQKTAGGNGFNIIHHSIRAEVARLYDQVRSNIPSCGDIPSSSSSSCGDDDGDNEDSNEKANPFLKVHQFAVKSAAEVERDVALAKAEEDLLAQFASLQQEHFKRTRRWVDVPATVMAAVNSASTVPSVPPALTTAEANLKAFEATVGVLRTNATTAAAASQAMRHCDPTRFDGVFGSAAAASRVGGRAANANTSVEDDPIQRAKNALNPYAALRPPRPSARADNDNEDDNDESGDDEEDAAFMADNAAEVSDMLNAWRKPAATAAASQPQRAAPTAVAAPAPAAAPRGNRWAVVEYEDDDEDEEDEDN